MNWIEYLITFKFLIFLYTYYPIFHIFDILNFIKFSLDVVAEEKPEEEPDDAEDDPEYNVLEDDDIPDELDLRFDNAVKITSMYYSIFMYVVYFK